MTLGNAAHFFSIRLISISLQWVLSQEDPTIWGIRRFNSETFIGVLGIPIPGAKAIGSPDPAPWKIIPAGNDPGYFQCVQPPETACVCSRSDHRIFFPGTNLFLSLANDGSPDAGTPVLLQPYWGRDNQMWMFQDV